MIRRDTSTKTNFLRQGLRCLVSSGWLGRRRSTVSELFDCESFRLVYGLQRFG